jgi:hypothetical protein
MAAGLPAGASAPVFLEQKQEHFMKRLALLAAILATFNVYANDPEISISAIDFYSRAPLSGIKAVVNSQTTASGEVDSAIKKSSMAGFGNDVARFASGMLMAWSFSGGGIGGSGHTL